MAYNKIQKKLQSAKAQYEGRNDFDTRITLDLYFIENYANQISEDCYKITMRYRNTMETSSRSYGQLMCIKDCVFYVNDITKVDEEEVTIVIDSSQYDNADHPYWSGNPQILLNDSFFNIVYSINDINRGGRACYYFSD